MTTLASVSLSREHQKHRAHMVAPLIVSLGLGLITLTGSHMHRDSNVHCSPRAQDPALTSQGYIESPFGYKASTHTVMSQ